MSINERINIALAEVRLRFAGQSVTPETMAANRQLYPEWQPHPDDLSFDQLQALIKGADAARR